VHTKELLDKFTYARILYP